MFWKRIMKSRSFLNGGPGKSKDDSSGDQHLLSQNFRQQLNFLRDVTNQISEDRKNLIESISHEFSTVQNRALKYIASGQSCMQDAVDSILEKIVLKNDERAADIERLLESLYSDVLTLCNPIPVTSNISLDYSSSTDIVAGIKTPNGDRITEVKTMELLRCIVDEAKEYLDKFIAETKIKGRETINSISRFLEQSQDIQREINIFFSVAQEGYEIKKSENTSLLLVSQVEEVEKNLLETFIFLNRQRFEMENLKKRLKYFCQKFHYVAVKFDTYWQKSNATYSNAAQQLQESGRVWVTSADNVNNSALRFMKYSETLKHIILDLQSVLKFKQEIVDWFSPIKESGDTDGPSDYTEMPRMNKLENCNQMLQNMLITAENTKDRLQSVSELSKKVKSLDNRMKSIAEGCSSLLSSLGASEKRDCKPFFQSRKISGDTHEQCLQKDPEDSNRNMTIFILKDIVQTTLEFVKFLSVTESVGEESMQSNEKAENNEVDEEWELVSSVSIQDGSGDDIVQDSDKFHFTE